jgi:hypothetical protein
MHRGHVRRRSGLVSKHGVGLAGLLPDGTQPIQTGQTQLADGPEDSPRPVAIRHLRRPGRQGQDAPVAGSHQGRTTKPDTGTHGRLGKIAQHQIQPQGQIASILEAQPGRGGDARIARGKKQIGLGPAHGARLLGKSGLRRRQGGAIPGAHPGVVAQGAPVAGAAAVRSVLDDAVPRSPARQVGHAVAPPVVGLLKQQPCLARRGSCHDRGRLRQGLQDRHEIAIELGRVLKVGGHSVEPEACHVQLRSGWREGLV